jgi:hypothetical protein
VRIRPLIFFAARFVQNVPLVGITPGPSAVLTFEKGVAKPSLARSHSGSRGRSSTGR